MIVTSAGKYLVEHMKECPVGKRADKLFKLIRPVDCEFTFQGLTGLNDVPCLVLLESKHLCDVSVRSDAEDGVSLSADDASGHGGNTNGGSSRLDSCPMSTSGSSTGTSYRTTDVILSAARVTAQASNIKLHGQMTHSTEQDTVVFFGTPALRTLEEMETQGIELTELPLHSHGREYLYGSMFQSASAQNSNVVDRRMAELDLEMVQVQEKKHQIDTLLHSILPPVVANSLAMGEIPPAERYDNVTVLFSDIIGFTSISSEVPAREVRVWALA